MSSKVDSAFRIFGKSADDWDTDFGNLLCIPDDQLQQLENLDGWSKEDKSTIATSPLKKIVSPPPISAKQSTVAARPLKRSLSLTSIVGEQSGHKKLKRTPSDSILFQANCATMDDIDLEVLNQPLKDRVQAFFAKKESSAKPQVIENQTSRPFECVKVVTNNLKENKVSPIKEFPASCPLIFTDPKATRDQLVNVESVLSSMVKLSKCSSKVTPVVDGISAAKETSQQGDVNGSPAKLKDGAISQVENHLLVQSHQSIVGSSKTIIPPKGSNDMADASEEDIVLSSQPVSGSQVKSQQSIIPAKRSKDVVDASEEDIVLSSQPVASSQVKSQQSIIPAKRSKDMADASEEGIVYSSQSIPCGQPVPLVNSAPSCSQSPYVPPVVLASGTFHGQTETVKPINQDSSAPVAKRKRKSKRSSLKAEITFSEEQLGKILQLMKIFARSSD